MHMADALLSPEVGGTMWAATGAALIYSAGKVKKEINDQKIPLMGILGAFIFAAQMINFTIPGTGSSGHLGGGMILAALLGPYAAFIVTASILLIQALFFADGGLLALGCNIFNLGAFPAFIAYPFVYKKITGNKQSIARISTASILSVMLALELGAIFVVIETVLSGVSDLPLSAFLLTMLPIHLAIGLIEGIVTAIVINFIWKAEPEIFSINEINESSSGSSTKKIFAAIIAVTIITGGVVSWFASEHPDGLEWSISRITGKEEIKSPEGGTYSLFESIQKELSFLPDYTFKKDYSERDEKTEGAGVDENADKGGKSMSGIAGSAITILLVIIIGFLLKSRRERVINKNGKN